MSNVAVPGGVGPSGATGPAGTITIGTTTTLPPGNSATVQNSGSPTMAVLSFGVPAGQKGDKGDVGNSGSNGSNGSNGAAATIAVGTVNTLSPGASATVANGGSSSAAVLNFGIPRGDVGATGSTGPAGPSTVGAPNTLTRSFDTAYQATDNTKPSWVSVMIDTAYSITVAGTQADTVELRIGSTSTGLVAGSSGTAVATFRASLTGIALTIGLGLGQRNQLGSLLPAAWWYAVRRVAGSTATISSATDQSLG